MYLSAKKILQQLPPCDYKYSEIFVIFILFTWHSVQSYICNKHFVKEQNDYYALVASYTERVGWCRIPCCSQICQALLCSI